jgi:PAS domain S-box-containing protein
VHVNGGFTRMFGWRTEEVAGRTPIALLAPQMSEAFVNIYRTELRAGQPVGREEIVVGKHGQRYWAKVISNPILDADGRWRYTVSMLTDITRSKMHEALQHRVLEAMARERPLVEVLEMVCLEVESIAPEVTASILEVDAQGLLHPLAGQACRVLFSAARRRGHRSRCGLLRNGGLAQCAGAGGRYRAGSAVEDFKHLILPLGFKPAGPRHLQQRGKPIGTFAFYYREPCTDASAFHQQLVDACIHLRPGAGARAARARIRQLASTTA